MVIDAEQNVTTYTYDGLNRQRTETITALVGASPQQLTRGNVYQNDGNLFQAIDRIDRIRQFTYDTLDRRTRELWGTKTNTIASHGITWQYDKLGRVLKETDSGTNATFGDSNDLVNTFAYDDLGRLTRQANYDPSIAGGGTSGPQIRENYTYRFDYVASPHLPDDLEFRSRVYRTQSFASGNVGIAQTVYQRDRLDNLSYLLDTDSDTSTSSPVVDGKEIQFGYTLSNQLATILRNWAPGGPSTTYTYDKADRVTGISQVYANYQYQYDNASRITDFNSLSSNGSIVTPRHFTYDDAGQLTSKSGGTAESYVYDDNGNRELVANGQGTNQDYVPALANRLTNDGTYTYVYDNEGNITSRTKTSTGEVTVYAWDHRNRLVGISDLISPPNSAAIGEVGQITLSQASKNDWLTVQLNRTYVNPVVIVQVASANDASPAFARVKNANPNGNTFQVQISEWDDAVGSHGAETLNYVVVEQGVHTLPGNITLVAGKADVNNNFEPVTFASGFGSPPAVLAQVMTTNGANSAVAARIATVTANNFNLRVQEQKSTTDGGVHSDETVGYVALASASGPMPGVGTFQALVTSPSITDAWSSLNFSSSFANPPRVLAATQTNFEADPATARVRNISAGNGQTPGSVELHVEEENSNNTGTLHAAEKVALVAFAQNGFLYSQSLIPAPTIAYTYDAEGRRIKRTYDADGPGTAQAASEYFVYDGDDLALRFGNAQELTHRYLNGPLTDQVLVDEVFTTIGNQRVSDEVFWQLADQQGTIRNIVGQHDHERKAIEYDSFGNVTSEQNYGSNQFPTNTSVVDQLFYYTGQEWDRDAKLQNNNARWYDPRLGRFLSEDPSSFDGGDPNLYRYVGNSPPNATDPTGLYQAGNPLYSLGKSLVTGAASSVYQSAGNLANSIYTTGTNLVRNAGELGRLYNQSNTLTQQINAVELQRANTGTGFFSGWFGPSRSELTQQRLELGAQRSVADANFQNLLTNSLFGSERVEIGYRPELTPYVSVAAAAGSGFKTGGKAVGNATANSLSLGFYEGPFGITQTDIDNGYYTSRAIAGISTEILVGVGTGGLASYSKAGTAARYAGKAALAFDTASNTLGVGRGAIDAYNNGLSVGNATQIVGSGLGLGGNIATGGKALGEIAGDAGRIRVGLDYDVLRTQANTGVPLNAINVSLAPKVHLNTNTAVGNFGVYEINVNGQLYKIGKADLDRVTQSTQLPTRVHQQVRSLEKVFGQGSASAGAIVPLGRTTTASAKLAETARIQAELNSSGFIPIGNLKSYRP